MELFMITQSPLDIRGKFGTSQVDPGGERRLSCSREIFTVTLSQNSIKSCSLSLYLETSFPAQRTPMYRLFFISVKEPMIRE